MSLSWCFGYGSPMAEDTFEVLLDSRQPRRRAPMDPLPFAPYHLEPSAQTVCYLPWLKVFVALRYVRTFPWAPEAWREVRLHVPWLLAEEFRLRKAGVAGSSPAPPTNYLYPARGILPPALRSVVSPRASSMYSCMSQPDAGYRPSRRSVRKRAMTWS